MSLLRAVPTIFMTLILTGCGPDQNGDLVLHKDLKECRQEADRFYKGYRAVDVASPRSQYIIGCMAAKNYVFDFSPASCDSKYPLPTQPTCYARESWFAWVVGYFSAN